MLPRWKFMLALAVIAGIFAVPAMAPAADMAKEWTLVNPEGAIKVEKMTLNAHPASLAGKTVLLRWNGKHNGDNFLNRIGELLAKEVKDVKIIKSWEVAPETAIIAGNPDKSKEIVRKLSNPKPDMVIASQCD
jgi:hypothetical protein